MSNRLTRTFFFLLLMLLVAPAYAQQGNISISGKIIATEDGKPVPNTSINIERKGVGTATNAAGMFMLIIPAANINDTLKISCIGYKTRQIPIASLKNEQVLNIALEINTTELKEVTIAYYDPQKIIQKAIDRIPENYIDDPHVLRGFYRMYAYNAHNPLQLSEAVFDVYNYGYTDKHADLFRLIKARSEKNDRDFNGMELSQKPNSLFEDDIVNHRVASRLLNDEGLKSHKFTVKGIVDFQGYRVYQVDFTGKPDAMDATFRGRMYIDTKTYAFVYFDFSLSKALLNELGITNFVTRTLVKTNKVKTELKQDRAIVTYQEVGHKWVLASMAGTYTIAADSATAKDDLIHVKFNYQVTAVDTAPKESFSEKLGRNQNINEHKSDTDSSFWKDYNILLSDYNAEDVFKQIQVVNKLGKLN
jgi:hypothetical protein